jgi:hypothetical protein
VMLAANAAGARARNATAKRVAAERRLGRVWRLLV